MEKDFKWVDPIIQSGEITPGAALIFGKLLGAWMVFRESHDLESAKVSCCDRTKRLFKVLQEFENLMMRKD